MSTNGTHAVTSSESPAGANHEPAPISRQSVDERLEALRETIRTWDWRAALAEVGPQPRDGLEAVAPQQAAATPTEVHQTSEPVAGDALSPDANAGAPPVDTSAELGPVATAAPPMDAFTSATEMEAPPPEDSVASTLATAPPATIITPPDAVAPPGETLAPPSAPLEPPAAAVETNTEAPPLEESVSPTLAAAPPTATITPPDAAVAAPTETLAPPPANVAEPSGAVISAPPATDVPATEEVAIPAEVIAGVANVDRPAQEPHGEADGVGTSWFGQEPELAAEPDGRIRRLWSHPWAKLAVAGIAAALVVALVVGGIRLFAKNTTSSGTTATTATPPSSHAVHHTHFVAPISAAQLATFEGFASSFQNANVAVTQGFIKAGSAPTASQVVLVVVAYRTAVNLYNFQLHFIQWPASMQSAIEIDHAQLQALTSFLQAFSSVAPTGVPAWLSQLHDRANSTQVADNTVRQDLGLSASSAFP